MSCEITLLHATRGRPEQALAARQRWLQAAAYPQRVEHIFAIDADDEPSRDHLNRYRHCIVPSPRGGCVRAWNMAASESVGKLLVQLSDDWSPIPNWDQALLSKISDPNSAVVLRVSDGHRTDDLLCMAICTRAWLEKTGEFLHGSYWGLYSDDEFSFRAYEAGAVLDAREVVFTHHHPNHDSNICVDQIYQEQNSKEQAKKGLALFLARNPQAQGRWLHKGIPGRFFVRPLPGDLIVTSAELLRRYSAEMLSVQKNRLTRPRVADSEPEVKGCLSLPRFQVGSLTRKLLSLLSFCQRERKP